MYRISFEWPYRKCVIATYMIFNGEHAKVTLVDVCEFRQRRIFTEVFVRTDGQTDKLKL